MGMVQSLWRCFQRHLRADAFDGHLDRLQAVLVAEYERHTHDVLVVGAGGAG